MGKLGVALFALVTAVTLAAPSMPVVTAAPVPTSGTCDLPTTRDLIIWEHFPRLPDDVLEVGDADLLRCKPTLDTWRDDQPTGVGYCSKIAWASDNPGYNVDARPVLPLKNVIDEVGDC
jgi:hypothetical protein